MSSEGLPTVNETYSVLQSVSSAERAPWNGSVVPIVVTPNLARLWLKANTHNRKAISSWIARLTAIILRGDWKLGPALIAFDWNGTLLDGQNRLYAIIAAGKPCVCLVGYGFDPACFAAIDSGCKRTFADVLTIEQEPNYVATAAAYRMLWRYLFHSNELTGGGPVPTSQQLLALRGEHPAMRDSVDIALNGWRLASKAQLAFCHYLFAKKDRTHADRFISSLISGVMLAEGAPVKVLRDRLEANRTAKAKLTEREIIALVFKTWNMERAGREHVTCLRWSEGANEPFPVVR